jgi:hypothetical protein
MPSLGRWKIPQTRTGRRSISVGKLLEKERLGTLFKKHSHKLDGETTFQGLDIAIENDVGSTRSGSNADGSRWDVKYRTPYGYIRGTTGADGEEVDCYVGKDDDADKAYVVHQRKDDGSYDEDTVMLGYGSQAAAKSDILRHYSDPKYVGKIVPIAMERLNELIDSKKKLVKISSPLGQVLTGGALLAGGEAIRRPFANRVLDQPAELAGDEQLTKSLRDASPVPVHAVEGGEPSFDPLKREITLGATANPSHLAHELGHAQIDQSRLGRLLQNPVTTLGANYKVPINEVAGALSHVGGKWGRTLGPVTAGLTTVPELLYEGAANLKGYQNLKEHGASPEQLEQGRKMMLSSMGSYGGRALQGLGAYMITSGAGSILKAAFATKDPEFVDADAENTVGLPAAPRRRRGDVPSRDEVELNPTPKVEARGSNMDTHLIGEFHSPGGNDDLGKFGAALSELGAMSEDWLGDPDIGLSLATAREEELRGQMPIWSDMGPIQDDQRTERPTEKMSMVREAFLDELQKIAEAHGYPAWVGDVGAFETFVEGMQKEALGFGQIGQAARGAVGRLMPMAAAGAGPEVQAFRKGTGFFSTGMGNDLHAGGKMLAHNAPAAGQAAGLGAKDVGALGAMRPTSAGRRIAGETAIGAGHHMQHAGPGLMAMNPVGVPMGGAIEGFTRGVGKELQGASHAGVQAAGHALVRHAPKVGFGGEFVAGGLLGTPGLGAMAGHQLAGMAGEHVMHAAHGLIPHTLGAGVQEASMAAPRIVPRAMQALGQGMMGLKARAGHIGGKLVGA